MSDPTAITLDYLEELKAEKLTTDEVQEAIQGAVTLCETFCKDREIAKAEKAYEYALYWGDDKENKVLFAAMGDGIAKAKAALKVEIDELHQKAGASFIEKKWQAAKDAFSKLQRFLPKDKAIVEKLKEIDAKINPPAAAPAAPTSSKKTKRNKAADVTLSEIGEDVSKIIAKLDIYVKREQKTGRSVRRAVKAKQTLARMIKKQLVD